MPSRPHDPASSSASPALPQPQPKPRRQRQPHRSGKRYGLAMLALLCCGSLLLGCGSGVFDLAAADRVETTQREVVQTVDSSGEEVVRILNLAGKVTVRGGGQALEIRATVHANAGDAGSTQALLDSMEWTQMRDSKNRLVWGLSYPVDRYQRFHYNPKNTSYGISRSSLEYQGEQIVISSRKGKHPTLYANLEVIVPTGGWVSVTNHLGELSARDYEGQLALHTGSGDLVAERIDGRFTAHTGSGDIEGSSLRGELEASTGSGDLEIQGLVGNGNFGTGSGNLRLSELAMGKLRADTGSGNVRLITGEVSRLEVDTGSGNVQIRDVNTRQILADTGSGNIRITTQLANTQTIRGGTGSGNLEIFAEAEAAFEARCDDLDLGYRDAEVTLQGDSIVKATRGEGGARIELSTGSGRCRLAPAG